MPKYAHFDPAATAPQPVTGWFDTDLVRYPTMPPAAELLAVSYDQWQQRLANSSGWMVQGGTLVAIGPSAPTIGVRLAALAAERYQQQSRGVMFQAAGATTVSLAASDAASTGMLTASYSAARDGHWIDGTPWKMADGSFVPLTTADMMALALKVLGFIAQCFAHEAALAAALAADLSTDITKGWPANT